MQGRYTLNHPEKYLGDKEKVVYRSSWEYDAFKFCDNNPHILKWASEEIAIPYALPTPNGGMRKANYYPDLFLVYKDKAGNMHKEVIEIKPKKQTRPSQARKASTKMMENAVYFKNCLKWEAAEKWCKQRGIVFKILHEGDQFK